jgi:hypothetical protein
MGNAAVKTTAPSKAESVGAAIQRLAELSDQAKAIEKEKDALKEQFRTWAAGKDAQFVLEGSDLEVAVTAKERTGWDGDLLERHFGATAPRWKKTTSYQEVSARRRKAVES